MTKQSAENILSILHSIPTKPGWFPKIEDIANKLNIPKYKASKTLKELHELGMLSRTGNWYNFIETIEVTDQQAKDYIDAITEENKHDSIEVSGGIVGPHESIMLGKGDIKETIIPLPKNWQKGFDEFNEKKISELTAIPIKQNDITFSTLKYSMLIIGIGSMIMSGYYTQIWQHETLNIFWSWFLSLIMIGFSSAAFLILVLILTRRITSNWTNWALAILFFILWIICLIYSIQATVAGRFAQYQEILSKNKIVEKEAIVDKTKANNLKESIETLKKDRINNQKQLDILLNQYDYAQLNMAVKGETFQTIQNRISNIQNIIKDIDKRLENKNIEYEKILGSKYIIDEDETKFGFYDWAAKVYKTDRRNIELWFMLFPSLFLDIASPIALAVFMFLGRKKEE